MYVQYIPLGLQRILQLHVAYTSLQNIHICISLQNILICRMFYKILCTIYYNPLPGNLHILHTTICLQMYIIITYISYKYYEKIATFYEQLAMTLSHFTINVKQT